MTRSIFYVAGTDSRKSRQMILPGRSLIPKILINVRSTTLQAQPCGVGLTLRKVRTWTSAGAIDFDNSLRIKASSIQIPFSNTRTPSHGVTEVKNHQSTEARVRKASVGPDTAGSVMLELGAYLVEFNERVEVPLDRMGQIFVRSTLFRSGALLNAGLMDSGYKGAVGAMLQVVNPHGLLLYRDARLAQVVFHQMSEPVTGYSGAYQGSTSI